MLGGVGARGWHPRLSVVPGTVPVYGALVQDLYELDEDRLESFKADVKEADALDVIRKHIVFGPCHVYRNSADYYELIRRAAERLGVHPSCMVIAGSAKLGFSVAPEKRYHPFHNKSDIDLTIVSNELFERVWREFYDAKIDAHDWSDRKSFLKYLFSGWIRPDFFPDVKTPTTDGWFEFFAELSRDAPAGVNVALYRDWHFFETYQTKCIELCRRFENGEIS